jgi:hypothetical protein
MELLDVTLTPVHRLAGVVRVAWADLADQQRRRGEVVQVPVPGEDVVLRAGDLTYRWGRVLSHHGSGDLRACVISIGAPVPGDWVQRRQVSRDQRDARVIPIQRGARSAAVS